jgi:hypothetical protein
MPEGRMLKKIISTSRKLANLKSDSARLLYTWLLPHLDIEGRFSANPMIVKGHAVPRLKMSPSKIKKYLEDMAQNDLIILYEIDGDRFLQYKKFKDFQVLRENREAKSLISKPTKKFLITPGVLRESSSTNKVKESKVNQIKLNKYGQDELDRLFEKFWSRYPKKVDKGEAKKKWLTNVLTYGVDPETLEIALTGYITVLNKNETPKFYVKHAKTFLYQGNKQKKIPPTWEQYLKFADPRYRKPDL